MCDKRNFLQKKKTYFVTNFICDNNIILIGALINKIQLKFLIRNHNQEKKNQKKSNLEISTRSYALKFFTQIFDTKKKTKKNEETQTQNFMEHETM